MDDCATVAAAAHGAGDSCPPLAPEQQLQQQRTGQEIFARRWHKSSGCSSSARGRGFLPAAGTRATVAAAAAHGAEDYYPPLALEQQLQQQRTGQGARAHSWHLRNKMLQYFFMVAVYEFYLGSTFLQSTRKL